MLVVVVLVVVVNVIVAVVVAAVVAGSELCVAVEWLVCGVGSQWMGMVHWLLFVVVGVVSWDPLPG